MAKVKRIVRVNTFGLLFVKKGIKHDTQLKLSPLDYFKLV